MAEITLLIRDETAGGKVINELAISFSSELTTVKDIIEKRVRSEVGAYNSKLPDYFLGLVQPTDAERTLNGYKLRNRKKIDADKQIGIALGSFSKNSYFVLIDNLQAESLEQMVVINPNTQISFVKLTPLVGG